MADKEAPMENTPSANPDENVLVVKTPRKPRVTKPKVELLPAALDVTTVKIATPRPRKPKVAPAELPVEAPVVELVTPVDETPYLTEVAVLRDETGGEISFESIFGESSYHDTTLEDARKADAGLLADQVYAKANKGPAYTPNGIVLAPGYWQAIEGKRGRVNVFAWLGVVFALIFFPLGLIFSGLGLINAKAVPDDKFSRSLGLFGLGISMFLSFLLLFSLVFRLLYAILSLS